MSKHEQKSRPRYSKTEKAIAALAMAGAVGGGILGAKAINVASEGLNENLLSKTSNEVNTNNKPISAEGFSDYMKQPQSFEQSHQALDNGEKLATERARQAVSSDTVEEEINQFDQQMEELSDGQYQNPENSTPAGP